MKALQLLIMLACLATAGAAYAQTTPVPGQAVPQTSPVPVTPETDKRAEFNAPQTPGRPAQTPSEDTLIKAQKSSGAVIQDTLMPSSSKKQDKMSRRKNKKGTSEMDDSTSTKAQPDTLKKP